MTAERVQAVVVGGGVIGCAILRELAGAGIEAILIEAEPDVGEGTSKANSAIVHTGFDAKPGTIEARMLRRAADLWPSAIDELGVPFLSVGALMLAQTVEGAHRLRSEIASNATSLGVEVELLERGAIRDIAPYVADDVVAALSIPGEAIVDPFWLTRAFAEAALAAGAQIRLGRSVVGLTIGPDEATVRLDDGDVLRADQVIDAAGIRADLVAGLAGDESFSLRPRKGQFLVSEESFGVDRIVLPIPGPLGKGMLVTPIVFGGILLGPTAVDGEDRMDRSTDPAEGERILAACGAMVPALSDAVAVRAFAGLRHVSSTGDFILQPSGVGDRLYLAAGIRSTGISTSPAVAEHVVRAVLRLRGWADRPRRPLPAPPVEFPEQAGEVVCLCRSISRGEIEAACRQATAPRTIDAVKRRSGATFGDCQGNLCALEVATIVATERGLAVAGIERHRAGSWLWEAVPGATPETPRVVPTAPDEVETGSPCDVIVVGAGAAGRSAAAAAAAAGLRVRVVERATGTAWDGSTSTGEWPKVLAGWTVTGLSPGHAGWLVSAQSELGNLDLMASAVILATGSYVEPREHRPIGGERPAGVMTADLAVRLLAAGLRPGARVALVGGDATATALNHRLAAAGASVMTLPSAPDELRGAVRLEAIRSGGDWHDADTLVLADHRLPQAFLLRGLGLVDARPGTPVPADADGKLPMDGLWAVGCCVEPDGDHARCAEAGDLIGRRVAGWIAGTVDRFPALRTVR